MLEEEEFCDREEEPIPGEGDKEGTTATFFKDREGGFTVCEQHISKEDELAQIVAAMSKVEAQSSGDNGELDETVQLKLHRQSKSWG